MKRSAPGVFVLVFLLAGTILRADTAIQVKVGGDDIALPSKPAGSSGCEPCGASPKPGDLITFSVAGDRLRRDRGPSSIILREDTGMLYFVCRTTKQYSELPYPVDYASAFKHTGPGTPLPDELVTFALTGPGTTGKSQIGKWAVETFDATVATKLRTQYRLHVAVADGGGSSDGLLLKFRMLLNELEYAGHGFSRLLPFTHGIPIHWEEALRQPETEFVYIEKVGTIEDRVLPPGTYDVPAEYKKVKFDPACVRYR